MKLLSLLIPLALAAEPLQLSLRRAVEMAISPEGGTRVQLATESLKQAQARSRQARSALLPNIDGSIAEQSQTRNLAAMGIRFTLPFPGLAFPTFVGPFNTFDARFSAQQSVFDFASIRRYQASKVGIKAAHKDITGSQDQVAASVARAYLAALKSMADIEAVDANIALAEAVLTQAQNQKNAGTGTGIEITRARVQLSNEKQRRLVVQNDKRRAELQLLRAMNLRLDTEIRLTGRLEFTPLDPALIENARAEALKSRADWQAQQEREANARISTSAVKYERLPTVSSFGDYGSSGTAINNSMPTRTVGVALRVPVFDGGRREARRAEAGSQYRQERIRSKDMQEQIALDVELAIDALRSSEQQVAVAKEGLGLAENELAQARRRYDAGVAIALEVTDAQTRLERARDNQTAALFAYNQARIDLGAATGTIRKVIQ